MSGEIMDKARFGDWLTGAQFYVNNDKYGQFGGKFVAASKYGDLPEDLGKWVDDLDAGDTEALDAGGSIRKYAEWYATGDTPAGAMIKLEDKMRVVYEKINAKNK